MGGNAFCCRTLCRRRRIDDLRGAVRHARWAGGAPPGPRQRFRWLPAFDFGPLFGPDFVSGVVGLLRPGESLYLRCGGGRGHGWLGNGELFQSPRGILDRQVRRGFLGTPGTHRADDPGRSFQPHGTGALDSGHRPEHHRGAPYHLHLEAHRCGSARGRAVTRRYLVARACAQPDAGSTRFDPHCGPRSLERASLAWNDRTAGGLRRRPSAVAIAPRCRLLDRCLLPHVPHPIARGATKPRRSSRPRVACRTPRRYFALVARRRAAVLSRAVADRPGPHTYVVLGPPFILTFPIVPALSTL